jgi:N-acetylglucosaminyl-diphospho-decaprenol L-rhamnosyltransferase
MSGSPRLAAVLVNYNAGPDLRAALDSIAADVGDTPWEGVVVDNASSDGSADEVCGSGAKVTVIRNAANVGFGRAVNQGIAATSAPVVLIMNPDCRLTPGAIQRMKTELDTHDRCAIVGPRILDPDGAEQGSARGDPDMLTGLFGRTSPLRRLMPSLPVSRRNVVGNATGSAASSSVDWVSGACMLTRRSALARVGGFDERYFLYWEDADLCRRLRAYGFEIRYAPTATAIHRVGQSSRTARAASVRAFHQSAYLYYATHVAPGALNPKRLLARTILAARCWWTVRSLTTPDALPTRSGERGGATQRRA